MGRLVFRVMTAKQGFDIERRQEICPKHGAFESSLNRGANWEHWSQCPTCATESQTQWNEERKREDRDRLIATLIADAKIPSRFQGKTFESYQPIAAGERHALAAAKDYAENFEDHFRTGRCMLFCGKPGTGKTHLSCAIASAVARSGRRVLYTTVADLIRRIRSTWRSGHGDESEVLQNLQKLGLLIIDEVGLQFGADAEVMQLTEIIDMRYRETKPTLIASNCTVDELPKYLGERSVDRLRENGGKLVLFDWPSHRGQPYARSLFEQQ